MTYEGILYDIRDNIAKITLNMPEKRNRLTSKIVGEIIDALEKAKEDEEVRVVIITGAGDKAFCVGGEIAEFRGHAAPENRQSFNAYSEMWETFATLGKPSIAAVNGVALAGGCGLAICPDVTIASDRARFGCPEINVGVWSMTASGIIIRTVTWKKALELLFTGDIIDAYEAEKIGLVNKVVPAEKLEETVMELANKLKSKSPVIMKVGRDSFYAIRDMEFSKAEGYLLDMLALLLTTEDSQEGTLAFLEKREPVWKGR